MRHYLKQALSLISFIKYSMFSLTVYKLLFISSCGESNTWTKEEMRNFYRLSHFLFSFGVGAKFLKTKVSIGTPDGTRVTKTKNSPSVF